MPTIGNDTFAAEVAVRGRAWVGFFLGFLILAVFTGEPCYAFHRYIHQPLRAGNRFLGRSCR
jgi:hypothetical protein